MTRTCLGAATTDDGCIGRAESTTIDAVADVIGDFVRRYVREQDFHERVAQLVGQAVERTLRARKIRAIVSWRGKRPDRLERKLREREAQRISDGTGPYADEQAIYDDVPDLAGARVALYFPGDRAIVHDLILGELDQLRSPKNFPSTDPADIAKRSAAGKRFSGYAATHFRVRLRRSSLSDEDARFAEGRCEIQVGSVLMHAWAEVEHDLEYKNLSGPVSEIESVLLDQINGLVMAGEIALEQLSRATKARSSGSVPDANLRDAYDLANWLASVASRDEHAPRVDVGPIDLAFQFIEKLGLTRVGALAPYAEKIRERLATGSEENPPAAILVDALREAFPERDADLAAARREVAAAEQGTAPAASPEAPVDAVALGTFLGLWQILERLAADLQPDPARRRRGPAGVLDTLLDVANLEQSVRRSVRELVLLRNRAVHATTDAPTAADLLDGARRIEDLLRDLPARATDDAKRAAIERALANVPAPRSPATEAAAPAQPTPLDVNAGPAVVIRSKHAVIVPFIVVNRLSTPTTLLKIELHVNGFAHTPSLPVDGLEVTGLPFREVGTGIRLEGSDGVRCALYFGPSLSGDAVEVPDAVTKVRLMVDSVRDGVIALDLDIQR